MKNKKLFIIVVISQFVIISGLIYYIRDKRKKVLGYNINPIKRENIIVGQDAENSLKYFFEPEPNSQLTDNFDWLPEPAKYSINSDSLNERYEYTMDKPENTYRIITIGDSFTFGGYVNTENNYSEQLEIMLNNSCISPNKVEVINLGVSGYDIQYPVERYIKRGQKYDPDLVIWLINSWNFSRINELLMQKVNGIIDESSRSGTLEARIAIDGRYFAWTQAETELAANLGNELLDKQFNYFLKLRNSYKGKLVIILFSDQFDNPSGNAGFSDFIDKIRSLDNNIYIFSDMSYNSLETLKVDPHPNTRDHAYIASEVKQYLTANFVIPCN